MHTKAARKRFVAKLPTEVVLGEDGCLSIPRRRALSDGLDRWLESIESPVGEIWQSSANDWSKHGLLDEIGPSGGRRVRAYWLGGRAVLLHRGVVADPLWQEICLIPLDETLRQKIRFAIDDRGTCWVGDLDEIVLHPRAEFPTDRRFKAVADGATHACALDDAGTPVCCGERFHDDPPAGPLSALALGADFDCGLEAEGALRCWGHEPPGGGVAITGPFEQIAVLGRDLCAVRRGTQALECWRPDLARMAPAPDRRNEFNSTVATERGYCTIAADGHVACDPAWPFVLHARTPAL
jgi:hypothetical protein